MKAGAAELLRWRPARSRRTAAIDSRPSIAPILRSSSCVLSGRLALPLGGTDKVDAFLGQFGSLLAETRYEPPSLESVFLSLTGRELRDRMADRHAIEQAAGRRAGRR